MSGRKRRRSTQTAVKEFVTVAFAEDVELAKQYKKLLKNNDIPAAVKARTDPSTTFPGIAVMVPEDYLDDAHHLIESQGSNDSFYDLAFEDNGYEGVDDLDSDLYDDSF